MHLPWRCTRILDRRALKRTLDLQGAAGASTSLDVLVERASDARDLFVLRGVRTRRSTVFQLMSRSLASDAQANVGVARLSARFDTANGYGQVARRQAAQLASEPRAFQRSHDVVRVAPRAIAAAQRQRDQEAVGL